MLLLLLFHGVLATQKLSFIVLIKFLCHFVDDIGDKLLDARLSFGWVRDISNLILNPWLSTVPALSEDTLLPDFNASPDESDENEDANQANDQY